MNLLTAIVLASFAVFSPDDAMPDSDNLQGGWKVVSFTKLKRDLDAAKNGKIVIKGDEMTASVNGDIDTLTFIIDSKANPPAIDMKRGKSTIRGIYKLEKDKLTICFGVENSARPTEFKSDKDNSLMVLERVKK